MFRGSEGLQKLHDRGIHAGLHSSLPISPFFPFITEAEVVTVA